MGVKCFLIERTNQSQRYFRRYSARAEERCQAPGKSYHDARVAFDTIVNDEEYEPWTDPEGFRNDPRWPASCVCGYVFKEEDERQIFTSTLYRRSDTGEIMTKDDAQPGAMWYATWMPKNMYWDNKEDTNHLCVRLPDGTDWCIDSRCNNCTLLNDRLHRCWVRTGEPPNVTVGKGGVTCTAGAGSIKSPNYHGYLRNGELTEG